MDPHRQVDSLGGVLRARELLNAGVPRWAIRAALDHGQLMRVRTGWVQTPSAPPAVVAAVRAGGRLACVSAAAHLGLWTPPSDDLHISLPAHAGHHHIDGHVVHWDSAPWRETGQPVEGLHQVLRQVVLCQESETAIAVLDSAMHQRRVTLPQVIPIVANLPRRFTPLLKELDSSSESGLESLCRVRLRRMGLKVQTQVRFSGIGRIDLLVGDRLIIETDGREWHSGPDAFAIDRSRDLAFVRRGYIVLRLSYHQVIYEWAWVERAILAIVDRREHLWRSGRHAGG